MSIKVTLEYTKSLAWPCPWSDRSYLERFIARIAIVWRAKRFGVQKYEAKELNNACEAKAKHHLDGSSVLARNVICPSHPRSWWLTAGPLYGNLIDSEAYLQSSCCLKADERFVFRFTCLWACFGVRLKAGCLKAGAAWFIELRLVV